ncbi:hypothetical protein ACFY4C_16290 [Actinomadura viridis]|uniref:hypothetical protein n=1 Tax=Actinomadura viridis TaxID=58110 RepID=UPI0036A47101
MGRARVLSGAGAALRQWRHPPEFRIQASAWPAEALAALTELARAEPLTQEIGEDDPPAPEPSAPAGPATPDGLPGRSVADVATGLWRLRNRLSRLEDAPRAVFRHLETAWDALTDAGVEILDHLNEPYDPGLSLTVVAFQPTPGLRREEIIETVRPTVYLGDRHIQMGQVIVGAPDPPETPPTGAEEARTR